MVSIVVLAGTGVASASTITVPTGNPYVVAGDAAGNPQAFTIVATGFTAGQQVNVEECDGVAPTTPGWDPTIDCDNGASPPAVIAASDGSATFTAPGPHAFTPFKNESPSGLFNCLSPHDPLLMPTDGVPDWRNCKIRVATSNTQATGDQSFLNIQLPDTTNVPSVSIGDASVVEGDGGTVNATFPVRLSATTTSAVTVKYSTTDGTAQSTNPADFKKAANKTLTIAAGKTGSTIKVSVLGDRRVEPNETFTVAISSPVNAVLGAKTVGTGTIINDDATATPKVTIGDVTVVEGNAGTQKATFDVTLDQGSASTVTVPWSTANGTATSPGDYTAASGTLSFAPGTTSENIAVTVKGDTTVEANETATVNLGAPTGAVVARGTGTLTILNDDTTPSNTAIGIGDVALSEGSAKNHNATFSVRLAKALSTTATVQYATSPGTATATSDYTTKTGTLTIAAGKVAANITVAVVADGLSEPNETFHVTLSNPTGGATLGRAVGTATILDDDPLTSVIGIGDTASVEGNAGTFAVPVSLTLSQPQASAVTVKVSTANGSAIAGSDYTALTNKLVTIAAGATSAAVNVTIIGDTTPEPNETFSLVLSSPSGATIGRGTGTFTILNDD